MDIVDTVVGWFTPSSSNETNTLIARLIIKLQITSLSIQVLALLMLTLSTRRLEVVIYEKTLAY